MKTMTPDEIRVAVAEVLGWNWWAFQGSEDERLLLEPDATWPPRHGGIQIEGKGYATRDITCIPDYPNDLNATHAMEKALTREQCYSFNGYLAEQLGDWNPDDKAKTWPFHATALQRCEAFLRTVGKWNT